MMTVRLGYDWGREQFSSEERNSEARLVGEGKKNASSSILQGVRHVSF